MPHSTRILSRDRLYVAEVAALLATQTRCSQSAARSWLYRAISRGEIRAIEVRGRYMIPTTEATRILPGDTP